MGDGNPERTTLIEAKRTLHTGHPPTNRCGHPRGEHRRADLDRHNPRTVWCQGQQYTVDATDLTAVPIQHLLVAQVTKEIHVSPQISQAESPPAQGPPRAP